MPPLMLGRIAPWLRVSWVRAGLAPRQGGDVRALAARYLVDPVATAGLDPRSTGKLDRAFARIEAGLGWSRPAAIERILALAAERLEQAGPTLYLNNAGSSGSHWVMDMLREGAGVLGQGEIYVPHRLPLREDRTARFPGEGTLPAGGLPCPPPDRYVGRPAQPARQHRAPVRPRRLRPQRCRAAPGAARARPGGDRAVAHPAQTKYRAYLGRAETDDASYLRENIRHVRRFYAAAAREDYDLEVRYEHLRRDPVPVLQAIAALVGGAPDPARLAAVAQSRRISAAREAAAAQPHPELRRVAERELARLRQRLGYV